MIQQQETICALSTPSGSGAIGVIRVSGEKAIPIVQEIFEGKALEQQKTQTLHFGRIIKEGEVLDEVLLSLFRGPHSYTGEDTIEISCHGSPFILSQLLDLLIEKGARLAEAGEFTMRSFMNGKMDLVQAESVADLIASESKAAHEIAMNQMRGGFSNKIKELREELIQFTALIELELDFAEEDVEFADRDDLKSLVDKLLNMLRQLIESFATGNVMKNGIPVAIIGQPNVGKSTLLNTLLNEEKAIVSDIAGTTRDSIEDEVKIGGVSFRFIDTAGIRETEDVVENIGIQRTFQMVDKAMVILYLIDAAKDSKEEVDAMIEELEERLKGKDKQLLVIANKVDQAAEPKETVQSKFSSTYPVISLSALTQLGLNNLTDYLKKLAQEKLQGKNEIIVSNTRHHQALKKSAEALERVEQGLASNITGDFLAMDIRQALHFLGEITGTIEIDRDILGTIFSQFCIGK